LSYKVTLYLLKMLSDIEFSSMKCLGPPITRTGMEDGKCSDLHME
jgi:hypothetical protein